MIVSPEQAAKLLCPVQRSNDGQALACRANACMFWRFGDMTSQYGFCGQAGVPEIYRLQSGEYPVRGRETVLTKTERTVDRGQGPDPRSLAERVAAERAERLAAEQAGTF